MSNATVSRFAREILRSLERNQEFRQVLNPQPTIVILRRPYLRNAFDMDDSTITEFYGKIREIVQKKNSTKRGGTYEWDNVKQTVIITGYKDNYSQAQRNIISLLKDYSKRADIDTGHLFTANAIEAAYQKIETKQTRVKKTEEARKAAKRIFEREAASYSAKVTQKLSKLGMRIDANYVRDLSENKFEGEFTVALMPQSIELNRSVLQKLEQEFLKKLKADIVDLKGSPSIREMIGDAVEEKFLTNKVTKKTYKGKGKSKIRGKVKKPRIAFLPLKDVKGRFTNLLKIKTLINTFLHDQVQVNMGKGKARSTLNYRTGRFARSAEATNVLQTRDDRLDVYYTWQHDPYDVFLPGQSRLATPGRDPRRIIGRAIRQLAIKVLRNDIKFNPIPDNRS